MLRARGGALGGLAPRAKQPESPRVRSIVLAVLAAVCVVAGILTVPVPVVGTVFSLAAPTLAITGVILGGMDLSRRKRAGQPSDAPLIGVVLSALVFFPALATTFTCGV